jgi:hypothetical protein
MALTVVNSMFSYRGRVLLPAMDDVAAGAGATVSARTTACRWGRRAVVMRRLLIGLFELKFDRLNTNSTN